MNTVELVQRLHQHRAWVNTNLLTAAATLDYINPGNPGVLHPRARELGGVDPSEEEMCIKIELLEERLKKKNRELKDKEIEWDRVEEEYNQLCSQMKESREEIVSRGMEQNDMVGQLNKWNKKIGGGWSKFGLLNRIQICTY